jgi:type I restriction enzyme M protein
MLDTTTRRRIDTARDILVGKVPDPKTQVEQITFAMIYKFMDDMDQLSVSLGGKSSFFANGYEQYAWSKLMDRKLGGAARMDLYVRALEGMSTNPHIPQLFRDIFKGAFMPYRDAETLNLFLKEMNGFTYAHSEDLGDAYEYLLSIFASQGKAGQFRTPATSSTSLWTASTPASTIPCSTLPAAPPASSFPPTSTSSNRTRKLR